MSSEKIFQDKIILICDPFHESNALVKKIVNKHGADFPNIHSTQSFLHAMEVLQSVKPDYVFTFHRDKKIDTCERLYLEHCRLKPNRREAAFFLTIKKENAYYASAFKRQHHINGYCFEPFNVEKLEKAILQMDQVNKLDNPFLESLNKGIEELILENYERALICFSNAQNLASFDPADAYFYQGVCYQRLGQNDKALERWNLALDYCSHHGKALRELFLFHYRNKDFPEAYKAQKSLLDNHPFDPMLVPHFILVSVRMSKYGEIYDLALLFQKLSYQIKETERSIAAGLVMSGRHFIANTDKELGRKILLKAAEMAQPNFEIFRNISTGLYDGGFFVDAYELIGKKTEENPNNNDFKILEVDLLFKANEFPKCLTVGMQLLEQDINHSDLFHSVIMASIKIGRNKAVINELVKKAITFYPEEKDKYARVLAHYFED